MGKGAVLIEKMCKPTDLNGSGASETTQSHTHEMLDQHPLPWRMLEDLLK